MSSSTEGDKPADQVPPTKTAAATNSSSSPEKPLPPGWARIASKKRPGKFYYFNASTNTSLWEHPARALAREAKIVANVVGSKKTTAKVAAAGKAAAGEEKIVQLKNDGQFKRKNLAKERMDTLRTQLDEDRKVARKTTSPKKKPEVKQVEASKKQEVPTKKQEVKAEVPEKKPESKLKESKPKPEVKKPISPRKSTSKKQEDSKTSPSRSKRKLSTESPKRAKKKPEESPKRAIRSRAIAKKASPKVEAKPKAESLEIIKKEAESLKKFKIPKKPPEEEPVSSPFFVAIQKLVEVEPPPTPEVPVATPKSIPQPVESPKLSEPPPRSQSTPKEIRESFTKSPANDRLAQLRNQIAQNVTLDEDAEMTDLSIENTSAVVEEMDWEDIPEEVALQEVVSIRRSLGLKLANPALNTSIPESTLLDPVSFSRYFFMVVDTNIFLSHLKSLERLLTTGIPSVGQPILILPYMVLQELDRIKHREAGRPLSQAASASIRFLNEHLKRRDPRVKGQSTIEAASPIVPIENPDDHILSCALQVGRNMQQGAELLLLSNDVNLRNKALVSGLTAVSFGELMAEAERLREVVAAAENG